MTIVAVKNGVMAVDSLVTQGDAVITQVQKYRPVPGHFGGGWIAGAGSCEGTAEAMELFVKSGGPIDKIAEREMDFCHLKADGSVWLCDWGCWVQAIGDFVAIGSGMQIAVGAMAAGCSAEEAAQIACEYTTSCGGRIHVLSIIGE